MLRIKIKNNIKKQIKGSKMMVKEKAQGIGFFEKYLTIWVLLCHGSGDFNQKIFTGDSFGFRKYANSRSEHSSYNI